MSRNTHFLLAVASVAIAIGCEPKRTSAEGGPLDVVAKGVDSSITLGAWLRAHPADTVESTEPEAASESGRACRSARGSALIGGHTFQRSAVFYIPEAPTGEALPTDTARLAERVCLLGSIWLETSEKVGSGLQDSLARVLTASLGAAADAADISGFGIGLWSRPQSWRMGHSVLVIAEKVDGSSVSTVLVTYAHNSGLSRKNYSEDAETDSLAGLARVRTLDSVDSAIARARVSVLGSDLRFVLERLRGLGPDDPFRTPAVDSGLLRIALGVHGLDSVDAPRRAAALLAADYLMAAAAGTLALDSTSKDADFYRRLTAAGVTYDQDPLGGRLVYSRPWLWAAYSADSLGATGREAFLTLLAQGWTTHANCQDGSDMFAQVIDHGEAALRRGWNDPMIHLQVATAYRDIVTMALGADGSGYVDSTRFMSQLPSAREHALAHYQAALTSLTNPAERREAWTNATQVLLSRPPRGMRFYCIYD